MAQGTGIYRAAISSMALCQGEIISNLIQPVPVFTEEASVSEDLSPYEVDEKNHPWAIVMSQDCDLAQDCARVQDGVPLGKILPNILFCEVKTAQTEVEEIPKGEKSSRWERIKKNSESRFHFLEKAGSDVDAIGEGLEEFVIDFKRYFTIDPKEVYRQLNSGTARKRCVLISPYLEHLAQRFYAFQSRVALDKDHFSE